MDTDQIVPARFLKRIERTGFRPFLFYEWRQDPSFVLNDERYARRHDPPRGRELRQRLQREHAPWALEDHGFRAVIAPSFADIFRTTAARSGSCPVELPGESVRALMDAVLDDPATRTGSTSRRSRCRPRRCRSPSRSTTSAGGASSRATTTSTSLRHTDAVAAYEASRSSWLPTA